MSFDRLAAELRDMAGLRALIARSEPEGLNLDYKAAAGLERAKVKDQVAKPLSAMANAEGGVVLYGVRTTKLPNDNRDYPVGVDKADPKLIDQLRNWANEYIVPPIPGLDVRPLGDSASGELAIAVLVPRSPLRPHQAKEERRYFRRTADATEFMDHANMELLFRTRIQRELAQQPIVAVHDGKGGVLEPKVLSVWIHNVGNSPALNLEVSLYDCVLGRRSALGSDLWHLVQPPIDRLHWNQVLAKAVRDTPPLVIRFEDVAGAVYRTESGLRRDVGGESQTVMVTGVMRLTREK